MRKILKRIIFQFLGAFLPPVLAMAMMVAYREYTSIIEPDMPYGIALLFMIIIAFAVGLLCIIIESVLPLKQNSAYYNFVVGASYSSILLYLVNPYLGPWIALVINPITLHIALAYTKEHA